MLHRVMLKRFFRLMAKTQFIRFTQTVFLFPQEVQPFSFSRHLRDKLCHWKLGLYSDIQISTEPIITYHLNLYSTYQNTRFLLNTIRLSYDKISKSPSQEHINKHIPAPVVESGFLWRSTAQ